MDLSGDKTTGSVVLDGSGGILYREGLEAVPETLNENGPLARDLTALGMAPPATPSPRPTKAPAFRCIRRPPSLRNSPRSR